MKKIIGVLTIMAATFCNAESNNGLVFPDMPQNIGGCSIGMMSNGVIVTKIESDLHKCATNDLIKFPPAYSDETRRQMAEDLSNARTSEIWPISKRIGGEIRVYFEICGNGFTVSEKKQIEKEIREAIQKILDNHFDK